MDDAEPLDRVAVLDLLAVGLHLANADEHAARFGRIPHEPAQHCAFLDELASLPRRKRPIPGVAATPSENFDRWALGADLELAVRTGIGWTQLRAEVTVASNLDRGLFVADPVATGLDVRELGGYVAILQDLGARVFAGLRADYYDPNLDSLDGRGGMLIPFDETITTISPLVGVRLPYRVRAAVQYDAVLDHLTRDARGVPADLANNRVIPRACRWSYEARALDHGSLGHCAHGVHGADRDFGLDEPLRVRGGTFIAEPLPVFRADTSAEPTTPAITLVQLESNEVRLGQAGKDVFGRASTESVAVGIAFEGLGTGYWVSPVGPRDPTAGNEFTWALDTSIGWDLPIGPAAIDVVAIDGAGRAGRQQRASLCVRPDLLDNGSTCNAALAPPIRSSHCRGIRTSISISGS